MGRSSHGAGQTKMWQVNYSTRFACWIGLGQRAITEIHACLVQLVVLLGLVQSTGATEKAGTEDKLLNNKGLTTEQAIILKVFTDFACRSLLEARQGDVRAELTVFRFQAEVEEAGGDLALQEVEGFALFDAGPDDARLAAWGKEAYPLQLQGELRHRYLG